MADICAVPLIDISEPTGNVMWEIDELVRRFGDHCAFIGDYGRLQQLIAQPHDTSPQQLTTFLDGRKVLAYTADDKGTKRFVHALSQTLNRNIRRRCQSGPDPSLVPGS